MQLWVIVMITGLYALVSHAVGVKGSLRERIDLSFYIFQDWLYFRFGALNCARKSMIVDAISS